ncbi:MAG: oxygen-independent coproporphyrinogen III oxidase [Paludibacter sp.]|nr:oxygen-independent coproporphyrinogen III oxidase [Paludibacter sp.]
MEISENLFQKYNVPVPRYTSYPPATAFHAGFSSDNYVEQIKSSNNAEPQNISIYIHIPFCTQRCHFCGCNTALSQSEDRINRYIDAVIKEIRHVAQYVDKKRRVTQVSWGGGTPNSIDLAYVRKIMSVLKSEFLFADFAEIAMECSPAYLDFEDVDILHEIGFNRISLGIQDFHLNVLEAINRRAPKHDVGEMLAYMKNKGFNGLNLDLVYGLPLQTPTSFMENIERVIELQPDRIATFSYAHIPWFNEAQRLMEKHRFPTPDEKLEMLVFAINQLTLHGYEVIGMDHFARKNDELAIAKQNKMLHRNFQGYNTKKTTGQVYAFGASGISQLNGAFAQNIKQYDKYIESIESCGLAVERGYILSKEDIVIRNTINEIMCNGFLDFEQMAAKSNCSVKEFLAITKFNTSKISTLIEDGLVKLTENWLQVTPEGMLIVRNVAVAFDPNFVPVINRYSTTI